MSQSDPQANSETEPSATGASLADAVGRIGVDWWATIVAGAIAVAAATNLCRRFRGDAISATTVDTDEERFEQTFPTTNVLAYVPGVLLLIVIGLLGKYAQIGWNALAKQQGWTVPDIEYVLWAILIGLLITNTVGVHRVFRPGVQTYEFWLKIGIVALGSRFVLGDVAKLGGTSLVQILVDMAVAGAIISPRRASSDSPASSARCWPSARRSAVCPPSSRPRVRYVRATPRPVTPSRRYWRSGRWPCSLCLLSDI